MIVKNLKLLNINNKVFVKYFANSIYQGEQPVKVKLGNGPTVLTVYTINFFICFRHIIYTLHTCKPLFYIFKGIDYKPAITLNTNVPPLFFL